MLFEKKNYDRIPADKGGGIYIIEIKFKISFITSKATKINNIITERFQKCLIYALKQWRDDTER